MNQENTATPLLTILNHLVDGNSIPMIKAKLIQIYEGKSGTNANGEWSIQNGTLDDGTVQIPVQFMNRDAVPLNWKGRDLILTSYSGGKNGMTGLKAFDDTYKQPHTRKVKVTSTADIVFAEQGQQQQPADNDGGHQSEPQNQGQQEQPPPPVKKKASPLTEVKKTLVQIANLHVLCRISMERVEAPLLKEITGRTMGEGEMQAATSSIFIKADRLGLHNEMPTRPFTAADFPTK